MSFNLWLLLNNIKILRIMIRVIAKVNDKYRCNYIKILTIIVLPTLCVLLLDLLLQVVIIFYNLI